MIGVLPVFCCSFPHLFIHTPRPQRAWPWWITSSSTSKIIHLHEKELRRPILSCLLLPPSASSTSAFLQARCPRLGLTTLLAGTRPILGNFLAPILREFFWKTRCLPANENLTSHSFASCFLLYSQLLQSRPQVPSSGFNACRKTHSSFLLLRS